MNIEQLLPKQALTATLEIIINKGLSLDDNLRVQTNKLNGKSLTLVLAELGFPITFHIDANGITVLASCLADDCVIKTNLATLAKLKQASLLTSLIRSGELDIIGDPKIAQQFSSLAEQLNIDWEQQLALHIGDIGAYKVNKLGKQLLSKLSFAKQQISQDAIEYLLHEKQLLVDASQLQIFNQGVSDVEQQVQQLEQRLQQLSQHLVGNSDSKH